MFLNPENELSLVRSGFLQSKIEKARFVPPGPRAYAGNAVR